MPSSYRIAVKSWQTASPDDGKDILNLVWDGGNSSSDKLKSIWVRGTLGGDATSDKFRGYTGFLRLPRGVTAAERGALLASGVKGRDLLDLKPLVSYGTTQMQFENYLKAINLGIGEGLYWWVHCDDNSGSPPFMCAAKMAVESSILI